MDHMMPVMDGIEATARIRALGRNGDIYYKNLPVVSMTANAVSGMREMFLENGFDDFLSKPIDTTTLDAILEKWIPDAKKENPPEAGGRNNKGRGGVGFLNDIDGLDVSQGIKMTGGTYEKYVRVLEEFYEEGLEKIKEIKLCLEAEDLHLFTTYIHAIKNGCSISGAEGLSEAAHALELAGAKKDSNFIRENAAIFLSDFEMLLSKICEALSAENVEEKKDSVDIDTLRHYLQRFRTALVNLNNRELKEVAGYLQNIKYDAESDSAVSGILYKRLIGDYSGALSLTNILLEKLLKES
jgi:CheY-like chemotaxis protein